LEKKFLFIVISVILVSISPQIFAEETLDELLEQQNGVLIEQQTIIFELGKHSNVHVKHVIEIGAWNADRPRIIEILPGAHSNLVVADEDGDTLNSSYDDETFEKSKYIFLNQKNGNYDLIAEYDLENYMKLEDGLWKKDMVFLFDIVLMIEDDIELVFVNSRPIDVSDAKGINCIGCGLTIEFFEDEKKYQKKFSSNQGDFEVEFLSNGEIFNIEFIEGGNQIERVTQLLNFDVNNKNQLYILKIPLQKFLNPYQVYFTEKDDTSLDQLDKIRKTEISQDETHVNISFRTVGEGTISIVGATPEEHQKRLEQIENMKANQVKSEKVEEEKKGIALPIPGTKAASESASEFGQMNEGGKENTLSFADELEKDQIQNSDNSMIIVGIIVGVIFKLKKN